MINSRTFNFMELDERRGILTKRSLNRGKLITEIQWYLKLPKPLHYLAPRIFAYSLYSNAPYIQMEFYGYRTLHEIFLDKVSASVCKKIFQSLLLAVEDMHAHRPPCDRRTAQAAVRSMCVDKTIQRLDKLRLNDDFKNFFTQKVIVNGKTFRSLDEIIALLPAQVERLLFENVEEYFSVIHGDLCLPNILVEEEHKFLRLVDPRGKFGDFDIYGD